MTLRALLWDLDGTLLDTEGLWLAAETDVMARHGYRWTDVDQRYCLGGPIERVAQYMSQRVAHAVSPEVVAEQLLVSMERHLRSHDPAWRPGSLELIRAARTADIQLALVTASHRRLLDALDSTLEGALTEFVGGAPPVFPVTVAGDEVRDTKPNPAPYLKAAQLLGVGIEECVVIEDSPTGVRSGIASGALVIAVPHIIPIEPAPRCRIVPSLADLDLTTVRSWHSQSWHSHSWSSPS